MDTTVIIFGSATHPTPGTPGDIDVAWDGDRDEAARIARNWADARGWGHLELDMHYTRVTLLAGGRAICHLPTPPGPGGRRTAEIVSGPQGHEVDIDWIEVDGLAALVRGYGHDRKAFRKQLLSQKWWRFTAVPAVWDTSGGDWDEYVAGVVALRSALAKNPQAGREIFRRWPILERLVAEEPRPLEEDLDALRGASAAASGGAVILVLTVLGKKDGGIKVAYGPEGMPVPLDPDRLERVLWPEPAVV